MSNHSWNSCEIPQNHHYFEIPRNAHSFCLHISNFNRSLPLLYHMNKSQTVTLKVIHTYTVIYKCCGGLAVYGRIFNSGSKWWHISINFGKCKKLKLRVESMLWMRSASTKPAQSKNELCPPVNLFGIHLKGYLYLTLSVLTHDQECGTHSVFKIF